MAFGERVVLASLDCTFPQVGMTVLMGPTSSGKSTLLRTLAGLNNAQPALRTWGSRTQGAAFREDEIPTLVMQNVRFLSASVRENLVSGLPDRSSLARLEQDEIAFDLLRACRLEALCSLLDADAVSLPLGLQRCLAIARALASRPAMLMVDEPTASLSEADSERIIALLRAEACKRSIVLVTHNQRHARAAGGQVVLLGGGRILEQRPTEDFFNGPETDHGRQFLRNGGCAVASPMARVEELADDVERPLPLPPAAVVPSRRVGPRGFYWLKPGLLGGLPRPGIVASLEQDLSALRELGVRLLVSLEETRTIPVDVLRAYEIRTHHVATPDMGAPGLSDALALCELVDRSVASGEVVAVHCKAGLGRTGTVLACQLVFDGCSALEAIERVRQINPAWIQSEGQVAFVARFAEAMRTRI